MNRLNSALIAFSAICVLTPATPVLASEFQAVHVKVPFAFTAGSTTLPAGDYTVSEGDTHLVRIYGSGGVATVFSTVTKREPSEQAGPHIPSHSEGVCVEVVLGRRTVFEGNYSRALGYRVIGSAQEGAGTLVPSSRGTIRGLKAGMERAASERGETFAMRTAAHILAVGSFT
jgi:hypothetical protein